MTMSDIGPFRTAGIIDSVLPARTRLPRQRRVHSQDSADRIDDPIQRLNRLRARITGALSQVKGVLQQYSTDVGNECDQSYDNGANDKWQASVKPTLQLVTTAQHQGVGGEEEEQLQKQKQHIEKEKQRSEEQEEKEQRRDSNGQPQQESGPIQFRFVRIVRRRSIFSEEEDETSVPRATKIATDNDAEEKEKFYDQQLSAIDANKRMQLIQESPRPSTHEVILGDTLPQIEIPVNAGRKTGKNGESPPLEICKATTAGPHATLPHDDESNNINDSDDSMTKAKRSVSKKRMGRRASVPTVDDPQIIMTSMTTIVAPFDSYRLWRPSESVAVTERIARGSPNNVRDNIGNSVHLMPNVKFITKTARDSDINATTVSNTITTTTKATLRANNSYDNARMKMLAIQLPVSDDRIHRSIETIKIGNGKPEVQDCQSTATDESTLDVLHPFAISIVTSTAATAAEAIITWCTEAISTATTVITITTATAIETSTAKDTATTTSTATPVVFALENIQNIDETRVKLNDSRYSKEQQDENATPPAVKKTTASNINNDAKESISTDVTPSITIAMPELHLKTRPVVMADEDSTPFSETKDQLVEFIDSGNTATLNDNDGNDDSPKALDDELTVVALSTSQKRKRKIKKKVIIKRQQSNLSSGDTFFLVSSGDPASAPEETLEKPVEYAKVHSDEEQEYEAIVVPTIPLKTCLKTREFQVGDIVMYAERYKKTQVRWKRGTVLERITSISYKLDIDGKEVSAHISYIKKYTGRRVNFGGKEYLEIDYEQLADDEAAGRSCSYNIWKMV